MTARMASLAALVLLIALAACGGSPAHHVSCAAQYRAWKNGPARPVATTMASYLTDMDFKGAVPSAQRLESMPMPACADPAGYWPQLLRKIEALGSNEQAGLGYILAQAQQIIGLEDRISAELQKTASGEVTG